MYVGLHSTLVTLLSFISAISNRKEVVIRKSGCGGGFFPRERGFEEEGSTIHFPPAIIVFQEISSPTPIPLLGQDQSTVAQRAETTV